MTAELDEIITLDEMPGWIRVSRQNIVKRAREGRELPPYFRCGRKFLWRRSVVEAWIAEQEAKSVAASEARAP
jgi:hypothetical protein